MDYFDKDGIYKATGLGVCKAFYTAFLAQVRGPILEKYGSYEMNHLLKNDVVYDWMFSERCIDHVLRQWSLEVSGKIKGYDVEEFLIQKECFEEFQKDYGKDWVKLIDNE